MQVNGNAMQSIWYDGSVDAVQIIDQTLLPHELKIVALLSLEDACHAISHMQVRGAPLIGVTAAYGVYLAMRNNAEPLSEVLAQLLATRPTAVNLRWALERCRNTLDLSLIHI